MISSTVIDEQFIGQFLKSDSKHPNYPTHVKTASAMRVHAEGAYPKDLLDERRPNESETIKAYRQKIYQSKTKAPFNKVLSVLMRIRNAEDWKVIYPGELPKKVAPAESLFAYCEESYPVFNSVTKWLFDYALKEMLIDPNAVCVIAPEQVEVAENEYRKPRAVIFRSEQVMDFQEGEYAVLLSKNKSRYFENGVIHEGKIFYFLDRSNIWEAKQKNSKGDYEIQVVINHKIGHLPAFRLGGVFKEHGEHGVVYESWLAGMLPGLNEAAREYSDLQAEVVQHIHSEKWLYESQECPPCSGTGKVIPTNGTQAVTCPSCKGGGYASTSPFTNIVVRPSSAIEGQNQAPIPPAGYIQKDIQIVEVQDRRVQQHINDAYAAINFEFLAKTPSEQSGIAKMYDRQELNGFIGNIAAHMVNLLNDIYYFINEYRYSTVVPDRKSREAMLPKVHVPTKFDIVSEAYLIEEISKAKAAGISAVILSQIMLDYVGKKYATTPELRDYLTLIYTLDPLPGRTEDDKVMEVSNKAIRQLDYIISSNIESFVKKAMLSDPEFIKKTYSEQYAILEGYAAVIEQAGTAKQTVLSLLEPAA